MTNYRKKPVVVEAITFDELIEFGRQNGANIVNGMPWSFTYAGHPITHENDNCYLIPTLEGAMKLMRGDMLITGVKGEIYPCKPDIFEATYELVSNNVQGRAPDGLRAALERLLAADVQHGRYCGVTFWGPGGGMNLETGQQNSGGRCSCGLNEARDSARAALGSAPRETPETGAVK